jgi:hypothetical protein
MNIISFNTGRGYTAHGQRIAATQLPDGSVAFCDIDRGIDYITTGPCDLTQSAVMSAYDHNRTEGSWYALPDGYAIKAELQAAARAVKSAGY